MKEGKRERMLNVRLDDDEVRMLAALAEHDGLGISDWIRRTIRTAFRKEFPGVEKPQKKARK
jgi:hypothetical protein